MTGLYRVQYPATLLDTFKSLIKSQRLSELDRADLLTNLIAMSLTNEHGRTPLVELLDLLTAYKNEESCLVWHFIVGVIEALDFLFSEEDFHEHYRGFAIDILLPFSEKIGGIRDPDKPISEWIIERELRATIDTMTGRFGHGATVREAQKRFKKVVASGKRQVYPSLESVAVFVTMSHGDTKSLAQIQKLYSSADPAMTKELARCIGMLQDETLYTETVETALTENPALFRDILETNRHRRTENWKILTSQHQFIREKIPDSAFESLLVRTGSLQTGAEKAEEFDRFMTEMGFARPDQEVLAQVLGRGTLLEENADDVRDYLVEWNKRKEGENGKGSATASFTCIVL